LIRKIDCGKNLESRINAFLVLRFNTRETFHVRLAETEKNPKVRVLSPHIGSQIEQYKHDSQAKGSRGFGPHDLFVCEIV
jgi:hypothetical protein